MKMTNKKKVYYFNRLYPEYGIKEIQIKDILYLVGKKIKIIEYLIADYDIEMECKDNDRWISVYCPYEDEEILVHDNSRSKYGNDIIMSFNKEKIEQWYKNCYDVQYKKIKDRLKRFEER